MRTAPRQPPLQRLGLGRLSGKCYTGKPTDSVEVCLIPIAVGGPAAAFSRRSAKTGGNRNVSPSFGQFASEIANRSRCLSEEHPSPGFRGPAAGIGGVDPNPVVVDENVPEHQRLDLRHTETIGGNPVDQFLLQRREEALHPGVVVAVRHTAQALHQTLPGKLRTERLAGILAAALHFDDLCGKHKP